MQAVARELNLEPDRSQALRAFLLHAVRFVYDPEGHEMVITPGRMAREILATGSSSGDCDDVATLGAALAHAMGMGTRFVTVATRPGGPWVHVWAEARDLRGWWQDLDTVRDIQGIPPGGLFRLTYWPG